MLTIYRRHKKICPHRAEGRKYRRCNCPIWVDGFLGSRDIRQSLRLKNWEKAQGQVREWEDEGKRTTGEESEPVTLRDACYQFLQDAEARGLREPTLYKYRLLFRRLQDFAQDHGLRFIAEFDLERLRKFRSQWPNRNLSALKKLESLRAFFRFVHESGWIPVNHARKIANPKVSGQVTMPFDSEEIIKILAACERYTDAYGRTGQANARRLHALVLLLRYSGLRIRDAVTLPRDRIVNGKLFLYTAKTGTLVYLPLPDFVTAALDAVPRLNDRYYFWTGESKPKSAVGNWQRTFAKLFGLAGVAKAHPHRFRDTFAIELLLAGVPLERVSVLLGHQSVKVTERHYTPWVRARQEQLESDVRRSWTSDPVAFAETKGTPKVHGKSEVVN